MTNNIYLTLVVPAYNEEKRIGFSLFRLKEYLKSRKLSAEIILVDDGSTDRTAAVAREIMEDFSDFRLIMLPVNRGKGAAVRAGVLQARANSSFLPTPTCPPRLKSWKNFCLSSGKAMIW